MLVGIVMRRPSQAVLPEQIIALEKAGCERFHVLDNASDLDLLRKNLPSTDLLIEADPHRGVREVHLH